MIVGLDMLDDPDDVKPYLELLLAQIFQPIGDVLSIVLVLSTIIVRRSVGT